MKLSDFRLMRFKWRLANQWRIHRCWSKGLKGAWFIFKMAWVQSRHKQGDKIDDFNKVKIENL